MEARIGADVYDEKAMLHEFLYGSGDTHSVYAKAIWPEELKDVDVKDVKKKRPDLRGKAKSPEFAVQFGSDGTAIAPQLGISIAEARQMVVNMLKGMPGLAKFKEKGAKKVQKLGYIEAMPQTGHRVYWWDFEEWKKEQAGRDEVFWMNYKKIKAKKEQAIADGLDKYAYLTPAEKETAQAVSMTFKAASKWHRLALNVPTQGGGAVVLKVAATNLYKWIVDNGYWGKILLVNLTHDEINTEFPEELKDTYPKLVSTIMEEAAAQFYHKLPIPAVPEVNTYWVH